MKRREMLFAAGAAMVGLSTFPLRSVAADVSKKQKVLFFTRSAGFEHPPVIRKGDELSMAEKLLSEWGAHAGLEVVCSKDGALFDGDLAQFDCFAFYTSGDLTGPTERPQVGGPMSAEGKKRLLAAIEAGKNFVGIHSATDTFRSKGIDPYIAMLGAEFVRHGDQQVAAMNVASPRFPGVEGLDKRFSIHDEWYTFHKFAKDLHVILVQDTKSMKGKLYQRPAYPATWARMHGKGRVFYTSMGHAEIWTAPTFRQVLMGGLAWALGSAKAEVKPNIGRVTPSANEAR